MFDFEKCILYLFRPADDIWSFKNCIKTQECENCRDFYTPALSLFNYYTKVKNKSLYQFLINITLWISIWQISEVLKQRQLGSKSCIRTSELLFPVCYGVFVTDLVYLSRFRYWFGMFVTFLLLIWYICHVFLIDLVYLLRFRYWFGIFVAFSLLISYICHIFSFLSGKRTHLSMF